MKSKTKIKAGILGATGLIGQVFIKILSDHPVFEPVFISGSGEGGELYRDRVRWKLPFDLPEKAGSLIVSGYNKDALKEKGIKYVFSALPSDIAGEIESDLREDGFYVFSNAGAHRYDRNVPILIPDVNPESLDLIREQGYPENGFIVTNPNCSTSGLTVALAPLKKFGIEEITVSTYQAVSGAGYPGLSAMDISNNVIPHIEGEEEKIVRETKKILNISTDIFPSCVRVPTLYGHLETVWIKFRKTPGTGDIINSWRHFIPKIKTYSLTKRSIEYTEDPDSLRNDLSFRGDPPGMQVFTGCLRKTGDKIGFSLLVNNLVRGGAGGSVANAELFAEYNGEIK